MNIILLSELPSWFESMFHHDHADLVILDLSFKPEALMDIPYDKDEQASFDYYAAVAEEGR